VHSNSNKIKKFSNLVVQPQTKLSTNSQLNTLPSDPLPLTNTHPTSPHPDSLEPILQEEANRFVLFPIR